MATAGGGPIFFFNDTLQRPPNQILGDLFNLQLIQLDPFNVTAAVDEIATAIRASVGENTGADGITKFDVYLSYRVATESDVAEKLYDKLTVKGFFPFLDKFKLARGKNYKEVLMEGLKNSRCFVSLVSQKALAMCKDKTKSHKYDNVLIEIQTALDHSSASGNKAYIIPVGVGEMLKIEGLGMILRKFGGEDFGGYAETIEPSAAPVAVIMPPSAPVAMTPAEEQTLSQSMAAGGGPSPGKSDSTSSENDDDDDDMTELRKLFRKCNPDHTGKIDKNELRAVMKQLNANQDVDDSELQTIYNMMDKNGDDFINESDFVEALKVFTHEVSEIKKSNFDFDPRGVTIALFRAIAQEVLERNPDKRYWNMERVSVELIGNREILNPNGRFGIVDKDATLTYSTNSSLVDSLREAQIQEIPHATLGVWYHEVVGARANACICFAYRDNFMELVEALEVFLEDEKRDPMTTYFWFDMFIHNLWDPMDRDLNWWANTFATAVELSGETVMFVSPWENPSIFSRAWCVFELFASVKLSVAISRAQKDSFVKTLREDPAKIYEALCTIDLENAISTFPGEMESIAEVVRAKEGGFHDINMKLRGKLWQWVEETARALVHEVDRENDQMTVDQLTDLLRVGLLLIGGDKYDEAKPIFERALQGLDQSSLGPDHPTTLEMVCNLGIFLRYQGKYDEAQPLLERALHGFEIVLGPDSPTTLESISTLISVSNLGMFLCDQGKFDKAQPLFERALLGCENALGPADLTTLKIVNNFAKLLKIQGNLDDAKLMFERAKRGLERALGSDHKTVVDISYNLAEVLIQMAIKKGEKAWGRSTMIFVGAGRAGKTGTQRSMLGYAFEHTESTTGINSDMFEVTSKLANVDGNVVAGESRWSLAKKAEKEYESNLAKLASAIQQGKVDKALVQKVVEQKVKLDTLQNLVPANTVPAPPAVALSSSAPPLPPVTMASASAAGGGPAGSGPSSNTVVNLIKNDPLSQLSSAVPQTVDLEYAQRMLAKDVQMNSKLLLTFLDFGGQKVFESINQFFIVEQAVYVVVFNMECFLTLDDRIPVDPEKGITTWSECLKDLLHWLNTVVVHTMKQGSTKPAPIFIVGTHKDTVLSPYDHRAISEAVMVALGKNNPALNSLQSNDEEGLCFYPTDNTRGLSDLTMTTLMKRIEAVIEMQDYVKKMLPLLWFRVLDWMNAQPRHYLTYDEVAKYAKECGFDMSTTQAVDDMLSMFHDCNVLMWHNVDGLRHIVILNPTHFFVDHATYLLRQHTGTATDATVHSLPKSMQEKIQSSLQSDFREMVSAGIITQRLLDVLLSESGEPKVVIQLMITYALLVPLVLDEGDVSGDGSLLKYLVPALLPKKPNNNAQGANGHRFFLFFSVMDAITDDCLQHSHMRYMGFLPRGLFPRLIAKLLVWSQETTNSTACTWSCDKDSMTLFFGNQQFCVTHRPDINAIEVGMFKRETPLAIHDRLKEILEILIESFKSLKMATLVEYRGNSPLQESVKPWLVPLTAISKKTVFIGRSPILQRLTPKEVEAAFFPWIVRTGASEVSEYDLFISYRQPNPLTAKLADLLTQYTIGDNPSRAIVVFLDIHSLEMGSNYKKAFVDCLVRSRLVVPFVSWAALARMMTHDAATGKETAIFTAEDSVLIEWLCSLRLYDMKRIHIMPLLLGNCTDANGVGGDFFERDAVTHTDVLERLPDRIAEPSVAKAVELMTQAGVWTSGDPVEPKAFGLSSLSVRAIVKAMTDQMGIKAYDSKNPNNPKNHKELLRLCATKIIRILPRDIGRVTGACGGGPSGVPSPAVVDQVAVTADYAKAWTIITDPRRALPDKVDELATYLQEKGFLEVDDLVSFRNDEDVMGKIRGCLTEVGQRRFNLAMGMQI